jgi:hypothetical protein
MNRSQSTVYYAPQLQVFPQAGRPTQFIIHSYGWFTNYGVKKYAQDLQLETP